ncbi:MAG: hypothetical protein SV062_07400 [Thermodesulfobacteriota bacterium]|nr:hypothetical protein [Thermodesulfobacteriota bacterium]
MKNEQFRELQLEIIMAINTVETLQSIYMRQTGKRFVSGQPIKDMTSQQAVEADVKKKGVKNGMPIYR